MQFTLIILSIVILILITEILHIKIENQKCKHEWWPYMTSKTETEEWIESKICLLCDKVKDIQRSKN